MELAERMERINVDFKSVEQVALLRDAKASAMKNGKRIKQWIEEAIREKLAREKK